MDVVEGRQRDIWKKDRETKCDSSGIKSKWERERKKRRSENVLTSESVYLKGIHSFFLGGEIVLVCGFH